MLSRFGHVQLYVTLWTVAYQAPLSMGFSKQEYWSVLPCSSQEEDFSDTGFEPVSLTSPALAGRFFTTSTTLEARKRVQGFLICLPPKATFSLHFIHKLWLSLLC